MELVDLRKLVRPKKDNVVLIKHVKRQRVVDDDDDR